MLLISLGRWDLTASLRAVYSSILSFKVKAAPSVVPSYLSIHHPSSFRREASKGLPEVLILETENREPFHKRPAGPMARRPPTERKIAGSIPA